MTALHWCVWARIHYHVKIQSRVSIRSQLNVYSSLLGHGVPCSANHSVSKGNLLCCRPKQTLGAPHIHTLHPQTPSSTVAYANVSIALRRQMPANFHKTSCEASISCISLSNCCHSSWSELPTPSLNFICVDRFNKPTGRDCWRSAFVNAASRWISWLRVRHTSCVGQNKPRRLIYLLQKTLISMPLNA